jgi:hypothetical protein
VDYEAVLLMGGIHDGYRMSVERGRDWVTMPEPLSTPGTLTMEREPPKPVRLTTTLYRRVWLRDSDGTTVSIFVAEGCGSLIQRLIDGYRVK